MSLLSTSLMVVSMTGMTGLSMGALDISRYAKVYRGEEGLEVTFVALRSNKGALIVVRGVDTELDGVVMRYEIVPQGRDAFAYRTQLHGEGYHTLHTRRDRGGEKRVFIFLPEAPTRQLNVVYDEARSKAASSDKVLDEFLSPKNKARVKALERWNREERVARQNQWLKEEAELAEKRCGKQLQVSIDWKSVTDDILKTYSVYGYCSAPLSAMRRICEQSEEYKGYIQKKISAVRCRFTDKLQLKLKAGTLRFDTATQAPNQEEFAHSYLKNEL